MIWQDRNMSEGFKVFYVKLYVHSLVDKLKWFLQENFELPDMLLSLALSVVCN